ncbi:AAA family ATPase [Rhodovulum sp. DZ06]|uniref:AAA family ATPase n=1 Tax=Rhodovulum sp. DZ06 TaxID=3425126 RepID=UPI003D34D0AA
MTTAPNSRARRNRRAQLATTPRISPRRPTPRPGVAALKTTTMADLDRRQFPERSMLIDPFLRSGETALVWGATGLGKTQFSLSLVIAMASGGSVGGFSCPEPRKVLLVDGEMHLQDIRDRVRMLVRTGAVIPGAPETEWMDNLVILARQDQEPGAGFIDLSEPEDRNALRKKCQEGGFDVMVVDNFTTVTDGLEDENASTAFKGVQEFFLQMKQSGIATILIHHARKDAKAFRGSQSLSVTFEVIIKLLPPTLSSVHSASFRLEFEKFRAKGDQRLNPKVWTLSDESGWAIVDDESSDDDLQKLAKAVRSLEYVSQTELADAIGCHKGTVSKKLKKAVSLGHLKEGEALECFRKARALRDDPDGALEDAYLDHDDY